MQDEPKKKKKTVVVSTGRYGVSRAYSVDAEKKKKAGTNPSSQEELREAGAKFMPKAAFNVPSVNSPSPRKSYLKETRTFIPKKK